MKIAMQMRWNGVTIDQYDKVRSIVNWEENVPQGAILHLCTHDGNALRVTDVWDSAENFNTFAHKRLMPGVVEVGITSQPEVEVYPLHALFTPAFAEKK